MSTLPVLTPERQPPGPGELPPRWPHQERLPGLLEAEVRAGHRAIVVTAPTGGGKLRMMTELAARAVAKGNRVGLFTNRRILTSQSTGAFELAGITHGVFAAGYPQALHRLAQVLSVPTLSSRCLNGGWRLPEFELVLIDEAHSVKAEVGQKLIATYKARRSLVIGFDATPVGLGRRHEVGGRHEPLYSALVQAGTPSELRACGALVPCHVFAPDEPDMKGVKTTRDGEFVQSQARKRVMETVVFGDVFDHWKRHNPWGLPTLLWAPGVAESRWFAEQFEARGVRAAHLDGDTTDGERARVFAESKEGRLQVICSCGVLKEGADLPWVAYGILVQACNALSTYLQICGRLLRAYPGKDRAVLQDHAGAWWRHGSPNADRQWRLEDTDREIARRLKQARQRGEPQPIRCPKCSGVRASGPVCPFCGYQHVRSVRSVRMTDGKLRRVVGDTVKKRQEVGPQQQCWTRCLYAAAHAGHTAGQAVFDFHRRTGAWPDGSLRPAPPRRETADWDVKVSDLWPWLVRKRKGGGS
jgi:DNA repair protein RadD